jgi:hypothetical protein
MLTASSDEYARFTRRVTLVSKGDSIRKLGTRALAANILCSYYKLYHAVKMGQLLACCPVWWSLCMAGGQTSTGENWIRSNQRYIASTHVHSMQSTQLYGLSCHLRQVTYKFYALLWCMYTFRYVILHTLHHMFCQTSCHHQKYDKWMSSVIKKLSVAMFKY